MLLAKIDSLHFPMHTLLAIVGCVALIHLWTPTADGACDLNNGQWVYDPSYFPHYSAKTCKSLRDEFACQRNGRKDWKFMKYVWRSPGCNIQRLNPSKLLSALRNKVLMHAGDSFSTNLEASMYCLFNSASPTVFFNSPIVPGGPEARGYKVPAFNFTVLHVPSNFLTAATTSGEASSSSSTWTVNLSQPDAAWTSLLPYTHYLILAIGHWFQNGEDNGRVYQLKGKPADVTALGALSRALRTARQYIINSRYQGMPMVLTYTATHYSPSYMSNATVDDCSTAITPFNWQQWRYAAQNTNFMQARDIMMKVFKQSPKFKMADVTKASLARPDGHVRMYGKGSKVDCSHFCAPGVPDSWSDIVYSYITKSLD